MPLPIKLSSPETHGFWEIPVLYEDDALLAIDKPAELHTVKEPTPTTHPGIMAMLHGAIQAGKPWAIERNLKFLAQTNRLDADTSGVLVLANTPEAAASLNNLFGAEKPSRRYTALVRGEPEDRFEVRVKMAPHPLKPDMMCVDPRQGKKSRTEFEVLGAVGVCGLHGPATPGAAAFAPRRFLPGSGPVVSRAHADAFLDQAWVPSKTEQDRAPSSEPPRIAPGGGNDQAPVNWRGTGDQRSAS